MAENRTITILENKTNIREGPGLSYQKVGQVNKGDSFTILNEKDDWIQIHLSNNKKGWVANWLISINQTKNTPSTLNIGTINSNSVNVRSTASLDGKIVGKLAKGDSVTVISQKSNWAEINFSGGRAWVSSQFVQFQGKQEPSSSSLAGTITAATLYVHDEASLNGKIVAKVYKGNNFPIIEDANNWTKIEYKSGSYGWVASWFLEKTSGTPTNSGKNGTDIEIEILYNGTGVRKKPDVQSDVVQRLDQGEIFKTLKLENDWYEISLQNGSTAFVAGWVVSTLGTAQQVEKPGAGIHLKNKTIVLDPGHGGRDNGTTGTRGTLEKDLTIQTATLLSNKLREAGANVILTRTYDTYLSLNSRVRTSHYHGADAFISIHYDSINERSVRGNSSFYYHSYQKSLASAIHSAVVQNTNLKDRGVRFGDYHVLRENKQKSVLLELGYLSNPAEAALVSTTQYQEKAAFGIYQGLARYFKN